MIIRPFVHNLTLKPDDNGYLVSAPIAIPLSTVARANGYADTLVSLVIVSPVILSLDVYLFSDGLLLGGLGVDDYDYSSFDEDTHWASIDGLNLLLYSHDPEVSMLLRADVQYDLPEVHLVLRLGVQQAS